MCWRSRGVYQEFVAKNLHIKYNSLVTQMERIVHEANTEIGNMRNRMDGKGDSYSAGASTNTLNSYESRTRHRSAQIRRAQ